MGQKDKMANFFSSLFGTDPKIDTQPVVDPSKTAVANPLSSYLSTQIGQGLPQYTGQLVAPLPNEGGNSVTPFLNLTSDQLIDQNNRSAINQFKSTYSDILEGSAGGLSSSSRAYNDNSAVTQLQLGLNSQDTQIEESLPAEQLALSQGISANQTAQDQAAYQNWFQSLAQNNPALGQALQFLSNSTSSGTTVLSALDPGSSSSLIDLIEAGAQASSAASSNSSAASMAKLAAAA